MAKVRYSCQLICQGAADQILEHDHRELNSKIFIIAQLRNDRQTSVTAQSKPPD
jgi:hypothetical protein